MRNRPRNLFSEADSARTAVGRKRGEDNPAARLAWLFLVLLVPAVAVVARAALLQHRLRPALLSEADATTESLEPVPCRNGRILSADGRVLARDELRFELLVEYRWLEEPADPVWLRREALARLSRTDRTDAGRIVLAEQAVLEQRRRLWTGLAETTNRPLAELDAGRSAIQQRVERMIDSVEARRTRRRARLRADDADNAQADGPLWRKLLDTFVAAVTTSPEHEESDPVVLPEEVDHHLLLEGLSLETAAEIESHPERFPGLATRLLARRSYPAGTIASHIVGMRRPATPEQLAAGWHALRNEGRDSTRTTPFSNPQRVSLEGGDLIGLSGVERAWDRVLRGVPGIRRVERNQRGETIAVETLRKPRPGRDLVLTLDLPLQQRLEELLDRTLPTVFGASDSDTRAGGCMIVLDVRTGAVLAAASAPRFDLERLAAGDADAWRNAASDPRRPLFHRAIQMMLPPGSVFKGLSAIAALQSGLIDPDEQFFCQGFLDHPHRHRCYLYTHYGHGHGETDLNDALARSCNVYFFHAARVIGPEPIVDWARRFGFGRPTGIDLPGEAAGHVPLPPSRRPILLTAADVQGAAAGLPVHADGSRDTTFEATADWRQAAGATPAPWYPGDTLGLAIGQSRLTVTPLQVARFMAAVANGGRLVQPHVVRGFGPSLVPDAGETTSTLPPRAPSAVQGLGPATLARVREGLERVVGHPGGTGYKNVRLKEIAIAGKTGTAEVGGGRPDHAWFAGYVPADRPQVAFAVVIEHGGSGGAIAGPLARELVQALLERGLVANTASAP